MRIRSTVGSVFAEIIDGPWQVRLGFYAVLSAVGLLIVAVLRDEAITSRGDLVSVRGIVADYRFERLSRGRHYALWLVEHDVTFRISADLIPHFDEAGFQEAIHPGDSIELDVARSTAASLESGDDVLIHGMRSDRFSHDAHISVRLSPTRRSVGVLSRRHAQRELHRRRGALLQRRHHHR